MKIEFKVTSKSFPLYKAFYEDVLAKTKWKLNKAFSPSLDDLSYSKDDGDCLFFSNGHWTPSIEIAEGLTPPPLFAVSYCTNKWIKSFDLGTQYCEALQYAYETGEECKPTPLPICVTLNDEYEAIVSESGVKVGCQLFDFKTVLMLAEEIKKFQKKLK